MQLKKQLYYHKPTIEEPGLDGLARMMTDGVALATDGCTVEPDGKCEHGHVSWLVYLEMI